MCPRKTIKLVARFSFHRHDEMFYADVGPRLAGMKLPALARHSVKVVKSLPSIEYGKIKFKDVLVWSFLFGKFTDTLCTKYALTMKKRDVN